MCNSSQAELFRVRFLYRFKDYSIKKVRYLRIVPTRKNLIFSAINNLDDDNKLKDIDISVETVPLCGGDSVELQHIKFSEICAKLSLG